MKIGLSGLKILPSNVCRRPQNCKASYFSHFVNKTTTAAKCTEMKSMYKA